MLYSVIIPCYCSDQTIGKVTRLIGEEFEKLNEQYEIVLVNDCSPDEGKTWSVISELAEKDSKIKAANLGKNAGQHNAVMAGLKFAAGERIFAMDDDMQTHPSEMIKLIEEMNKGYDIVYGYYLEKKENAFRRLGSELNFWTVKLLIGKPKWLKTSSYWLIKKYVRDYAIMYEHPNVHLQGVFLRITKNISCVPIKHFEREIGKSNYNIKKLVKLYGNIIGYSEMPLRFVVSVGMLFAIVGFLLTLIVVIRRLINPMFVPGWASMMAGLGFFSGLILSAIGMVGIYVGRIMSSETNKPQYVVKEVLNITKKED